MPQPEGTTKIRCHHCSKYIGESSAPVEIRGTLSVKDVDEPEIAEFIRKIYPHRIAWRCKCGYMNIFKTLPLSA